jgi:polyhydroxybutyrate depolymerase
LKRVLRFLLRVLITLVILAAILIGLAVYFLYTPEPEKPALSGQTTVETVMSGGQSRTYRAYVPQGLPRGAPLVIVMHGWAQSGAEIRQETGYAFDRLADEHGFAVVYPDAYQGNWNTCDAADDSQAHKLDIDDVGFLTGIIDSFVGRIGIDPARVLATGLSAGGDMAVRLALEAPSRFRAVAAVASNLPVPGLFKCTPKEQASAPILIMNGTKDPLNPFDGGEVGAGNILFRLILSGGTVRSSHDTARYFADLNGYEGEPETSRSEEADGFSTEQFLWHNGTSADVELLALQGAGHVFPQPFYRARRILGPTPKTPNGAVVIWDFFEATALSQMLGSGSREGRSRRRRPHMESWWCGTLMRDPHH